MADYIPPDVPRFLTPEDIPSGVFCRMLSIPDDPAWCGIVDGALTVLFEPDAWRQFGALTAQECADRWRAMLYDSWLPETSICAVVDAPYWESVDGEDADVEVVAGAETWFGYLDGANFIDDLAGWVFAGAVAISFGVDAAIEFATSLKRLRLLFRTGTAGAIVEVLLDNVLAGTVDTYSSAPGLTSLDVFPSGTIVDIHNTQMANSAATAVGGLYSMEIIKKRLWEAEIYPDDIRYDPGTAAVQQTFDGGATWIDQALQDPRFSDVFRFPPTSSDNPHCDSAASIVRFLLNLVADTTNVVNEGTTALAFASFVIGLIAILFPPALFVAIFIDLFDLITAIGATVVQEAFTSTVWDELLCIFYCNIDADGQVSADKLATINIKIDSQIGSTAASVLHAMLLVQGPVGLSNAGTLGLDTDDCSGCVCTWCYEYDFAVLNDFSQISQAGWGAGAVYTPGTGWLASINISRGNAGELASFFAIGRLFPACTLTRVEIDYELTYGDISIFQNHQIFKIGTDVLFDFSTNQSGTQVWTGSITPTGSTHFSVGASPDGVIGYNNAFGSAGGHVLFSRIRLEGTGATNPFGSDNC